jgi:transcriptional regulator with XRE-family HTH domain
MKSRPGISKKSKDEKSLVQTAEVRIASRLRKLRLDKGLTLTQLAGKAGLSQAFLSRVENHKLSIPISGLERLAHALEVSISTFFEEEQVTSPIVLCRAGKGIRQHCRGHKSFLLELLAASKRGKLMEPLLVDIATATRPMQLISHAGEEFNYVVKGEIYLIYGKQEIHLKEGDSVYYDAMVPHAARPLPKRPGLILSIVASKDYLFHGDLTNLLKGA